MGAKVLALHRERGAEKSLKTSPEKQACWRREQSEEERFWAAEELGSEAPRRCQQCRGCKECSFQGQQMSQTESWEYAKMKEGTKTFRVKYLFTDDPRKLPDNRKTITKMAELT